MTGAKSDAPGSVESHMKSVKIEEAKIFESFAAPEKEPTSMNSDKSKELSQATFTPPPPDTQPIQREVPETIKEESQAQKTFEETQKSLYELSPHTCVDHSFISKAPEPDAKSNK